MDTAFKKARSSETTTLMIGSSYGRDGFFPKLINDNCVNLAHKSQDVYYSCLIAKKVLEVNPNIKDIILGTGYYFFYTDISRSKGEQEQNGLIANIYIIHFLVMYIIVQLNLNHYHILNNYKI